MGHPTLVGGSGHVGVCNTPDCIRVADRAASESNRSGAFCIEAGNLTRSIRCRADNTLAARAKGSVSAASAPSTIRLFSDSPNPSAPSSGVSCRCPNAAENAANIASFRPRIRSNSMAGVRSFTVSNRYFASAPTTSTTAFSRPARASLSSKSPSNGEPAGSNATQNVRRGTARASDNVSSAPRKRLAIFCRGNSTSSSGNSSYA